MRDGLYYAQNMDSLPVASGNFIPFETGTVYASKLTQSNVGDVAITFGW